jgi:TolB-like protein
MKQLLIFLLALILPTSYAQDKKDQDKKQEKIYTIAILDFNVISGVQKIEAMALTSKFRGSIAKTKKYTVLERNEMENILKEQDVTLTDICNTAECAVEVGKLLAAEKMIAGDIAKVGETYTIQLRLIDVTTSKIEETESQEYKGKPEGLLPIFDILAQKITGTYKKSNTKWYVAGGVAVLGGAAAALLMGKKKASTDLFGEPPAHP